jgi:predicted Fe-Mo cluster-binding NifX family protein
MKIAIPTDDRKTISSHFGRTAGFEIVELDGSKVVGTEYKKNTVTAHAGNRSMEHPGGHHSHEGIFRTLADCGIVIARGMGKRLYNDFLARDITVYVTSEEEVLPAVQAYIEGILENDPDNTCDH